MSYEFASTLYRTEKDMAVAIVAEWASAGGSNSREEVVEALDDMPGLLAEMRKAWDFTDEQEEALVFYADEGRIGPGDVLVRLYGETAKDVCDYIKERMDELEMTQVALAEKLGVTQATVSGMVNGLNPTLKTLRRLADALGTTVSGLIGE